MTSSHRISPNRLAGCLADVSLSELLDACLRRQVTGSVDIRAGGRCGSIVLRLGAVDTAVFDHREGDDALIAMAALPDGTYELVQRLPDVDGSLGSAATLHAVGNVKLVELMQHCEEHGLSCAITAIAEYDVGVVTYRAGSIEGVILNGHQDEDAIVEMTRWNDARFRVDALPLSLDIDCRPVSVRARTTPFVFRTGETRIVPPIRRSRADTYVPPERTNERGGWGDVFWNCVAIAIGAVGERARNTATVNHATAANDSEAARPGAGEAHARSRGARLGATLARIRQSAFKRISRVRRSKQRRT